MPSNVTRLRGATNRLATMAAYGWEDRSTPCFTVTNAGDAAKLYVYDIIGGYALDSAEFVKEVHGLKVKNIDLHLNSPGGFVYDAVAMFEALRDHAAAVNVKIDGMAASAASFLAMSGDSVEIAKGGRMMIHDAQGVGIGGPADMYEYGDLLSAVSDDISQYYADRAGGKPSAWRTAMKETTWYSATQAVDSKLADRITGGSSNTAAEDIRSQMIRARAHVTLRG